MELKMVIFTLIGGLGFFFYGMQIMSEGLKGLAGDRLKSILHMATKVPVIGVLVGAIVTVLIQSSSATTVMAVGFVNAGLLQLRQAICVVMGANIGTTFTAWLVSSMSVFKVTDYALPAIGIGFVLMTFGKTRKMKFFGRTVLGFGLLFIGLSIMKDGFTPLKESQQVKDIFITLSGNPILGVLVGVVFTVILQSSSATIAIVQVLAFNGLITLETAIPIILGDNIGTTITAQLAAIGTNLSARRTAMSHTLFNVVGVMYMIIFVYTGWYIRALHFIVPGKVNTGNIMFYIALAHSVFNIVNTVIFLPIIGWLEKASIFLVPRRKDSVELGPQYLERHLLDTPSIALEQASRETARMLEIACGSVSAALESIGNKDKKGIKIVSDLEQAVDNLQSEITQYLVELSQRELGQEESEEVPVLIHSVNDVERIGDHAENIAELGVEKTEEKILFTEAAEEALRSMVKEIELMMYSAKKAFKTGDKKEAEKVLEQETGINRLQNELKNGHVNRLHGGKCDIRAGIIYIGIVDNIEKIGDHLSNIAQGVLNGMRWRNMVREEEEE